MRLKPRKRPRHYAPYNVDLEFAKRRARDSERDRAHREAIDKLAQTPGDHPDGRKRVWHEPSACYVTQRKTIPEIIAEVEAEMANPKPERESKPPPRGVATPEDIAQYEAELDEEQRASLYDAGIELGSDDDEGDAS